ncbi:MAG: right-handed parallel beta-helix repeat-containing protein [Chloroflexota bacterium]
MNRGMNDDARPERIFADGLHGTAPSRAPDRLRTQIRTQTSQLRPRPRWLALIKESPMRINSSLAVGSPTARVAAIVVATLLLALMVAGAGIAGSRLLAADGTIVVDQAGGGDYTTIGAAVDAAEDGDTIMIRPGTYSESVIVDKDLRILGDGESDSIVVDIPDDGPSAPFGDMNPRFGFWLQDATTELGNLTITGPDRNVSAVVATDGDHDIHDLVEDLDPYRFFPYGFVYINGSMTGTVSDNETKAFIWIDGEASPVIERNRIVNVVRNDGQSSALVRNNDIGGVWVRGESTATITDNRIDFANNGGADGGFSTCGVELSGEARPIVDSNEVRNAATGVCVRFAEPASLSGNRLIDNTTGMFVSSSDALIRDNVVSGGRIGISTAGDAPSFIGNTVEGASSTGFVIGTGSSAILSGNTICGSPTNLEVFDIATPAIDATNKICEDAPAE